MNKAVYGYCPVCGARGQQRERRPNGNDICERGHTYPTSDAVPVTEEQKDVKSKLVM